MEPQIDYQVLAGHLLAQQAAQNGGAQFGYKTAPSSTPTTIYGHGPGGLFSYPGMEPRIFSAMVLPMTGLQSLLPVRSSNVDNPVYGIFTGVTATTGEEPAGPCDDPPTAGLGKLCLHTFHWGRQGRQTRVFDITRVGEITNRSDFLDYQIMGNPFGVPPNNPNIPTIAGADPAALGRNEMAKATFELAVAWARDFAQELYSGNPANNSASDGRMYFDGLDRLINTGYADAITNVACPAADSLVLTFSDQIIDLNAANQDQIVDLITYTLRNLKHIAERAGLNPVQWVIAMRWGLFYELSAIWPISYNTYRDTVTTTGQSVFNNGMELQRDRDAMRQGQYLLIDGDKVPVVQDEAIAETQPAAGVFESAIYFVPLTVLGGQPVTFIENRNFDGPGSAMDFARVFAPDGSFYSSDGGRFLWHRPAPTNACVQLRAWTKPRLLLLTPHIAARITDVRYRPLLHERSAFTDDSYFVNGGGTNFIGQPGVAPSLFGPPNGG